MSDDLTELRAEFDRIAAALRAPASPDQRAALKAGIVALFNRTDAAIGEITAFKERIRELIAAFKTLPQESVTSVRHDHLGASTHIERGWSALAGGDWARAQTEFQAALQRDATSTAAQALLGWVLMYQNRLDEALEVCLRVLLREPDHGLARVALGAICLRKGIVGEAIEHLTRAAGNPSDARAGLYANFWLGVAYLERDMHSDAIEFLRRATAKGPNLAEAWTELGRALWLSGREGEAREAWSTGSALRHSPFARRCSELLALVAAGGTPPRSPFN